MDKIIRDIVENSKNKSVQIVGKLSKRQITVGEQIISEYYVDEAWKIYSLTRDKDTGEYKVSVSWSKDNS